MGNVFKSSYGQFKLATFGWHDCSPLFEALNFSYGSLVLDEEVFIPSLSLFFKK